MTAAPVARGSNYAAVFHPAVERALPGASSHRWAPARGWCLPPPARTGGRHWRAPPRGGVPCVPALHVILVAAAPAFGCCFCASPPLLWPPAQRTLAAAAAAATRARACARGTVHPPCFHSPLPGSGAPACAGARRLLPPPPPALGVLWGAPAWGTGTGAARPAAVQDPRRGRVTADQTGRQRPVSSRLPARPPLCVFEAAAARGS